MKRPIYRILTCVLALAMLLSTNILAFATDISESTNMTLTLYTASGEKVQVPVGTSMENGIYYNFYDSTADKTYDFFNPETGEFLYFTGKEANPSDAELNIVNLTDKTFTFEIRASVTSSSFKIGGTPAYLSATAKVINTADKNKDVTSSTDKFTIEVSRTSAPYTTKTYTSKVSTGIGQRMDWIVASKSYKVTIRNPNDFKGTGYYLKGSGKIYHAA